MTSIHVSIITPMSRIENFSTVYRSVETAVRGLDMTWEWLVTVDMDFVPKGLGCGFPNVIMDALSTWNDADMTIGLGIRGNIQRNNSKKHATGNWIKMLDDDTIMHERYFRVVLPFMRGYPDNAIVVGQMNHDGQPRLTPTANHMKVGGVDQDQGIFPSYMMEEWVWEPFDYCSDGNLYRTRYELYPNKFIFINQNLSWYNKLRPDWPKDHIR